MTAHVRRFDRALLTESEPDKADGVLEALVDHLTHAHRTSLFPADETSPQAAAYAIVRWHEDLHADGSRHIEGAQPQ